MVNWPVRKCYHAFKLAVCLIIIVTVFTLFEHWRGGKRNSLAYSGLDAEYEKQILTDEAHIIPGLGDGGAAVYLDGEEKKLGELSEKKLAMNVYLSDKIPYNRTLKDYRHPACSRVVYDAELPSASVIIIFHNEPYSVVIRTLWNVINTARRDQPWHKLANFIDHETGKKMTLGYPGQDPSSSLVYLKEIILVDDNSTLPELKGKLSHYVRTRLPPDLIRILRLPDREGLTRARLAGARYANGDVLIFLDAHCEGDVDWLRPMLQRIKDSSKAVLVPIIDVIESSNFFYSVLNRAVFQAETIKRYRQGLMTARMSGARLARGTALVFLDAHCEGGPDWLRPLLQRVRNKRDAVVTPLIDVVDQTTFQMDASENFQVGGFTFTGHFTWIDVPEREKKRRGTDISPTWSPTMAGGLFAINRQYYWELGAYDEQMAGWGGENLELSFRIWQCGGTLETIPCSRIGHVFRRFHPYGLPAQSDTHGINTARMADVWMDEYAELFYLHRPDLRKSPKIGDVTHRKILREKLHCKSFQWYLDNIYKEKFVPVKDAFGYGRFKNGKTNYCLDSMMREAEGSVLGVYPCHENLAQTQYFTLALSGELRDEEKCAEVNHYKRNTEDSDAGNRVVMVTCRPKVRQLNVTCSQLIKNHQKNDVEYRKWRYLPATQQIEHIDSGLCMEAVMQVGGDVWVKQCDSKQPLQRWTIDFSELNGFRQQSSLESDEQQDILRKIREGKGSQTQTGARSRRISRSLLSYPEEDEAESSEKITRRHSHTHKSKKKKSKRKKSKRSRNMKNKFILKLVRTLMNDTEDHLEVDIHCKHKKLYSNNTFVRDLVTILNEKNIKVINNGRVFERNKVTDLSKYDGHLRKRKEKKKVKPAKEEREKKLVTIAPNVEIEERLSKIFSKETTNASQVQGVNTDERVPSKKIIIEDFVAVKPMEPVRENVKKGKQKHKRVRPSKLAAPLEAEAEADGTSPLSELPRRQQGNTNESDKLSQMSPVHSNLGSMEAAMVSQEQEFEEVNKSWPKKVYKDSIDKDGIENKERRKEKKVKKIWRDKKGKYNENNEDYTETRDNWLEKKDRESKNKENDEGNRESWRNKKERENENKNDVENRHDLQEKNGRESINKDDIENRELRKEKDLKKNWRDKKFKNIENKENDIENRDRRIEKVKYMDRDKKRLKLNYPKMYEADVNSAEKDTKKSKTENDLKSNKTREFKKVKYGQHGDDNISDEERKRGENKNAENVDLENQIHGNKIRDTDNRGRLSLHDLRDKQRKRERFRKKRRERTTEVPDVERVMDDSDEKWLMKNTFQGKHRMMMQPRAYDSETPVPSNASLESTPEMRSQDPPLKVVMRSNLTFNLGDEFFAWKRAAENDDVGDLLEELEIPINSSRVPPLEAWVMPEVRPTERGAEPAKPDTSEESSSSDSSDE